MKGNKIFWVFLLLVAYMQNSCEHELEEKNASRFSFKTHTYNQAIALKDFKKSYSIFQNELTNFKKQTKTTESLSDFEIDSTTINEIRLGDITTYTLLVKKKPNDKDNSFENLILRVDKQGNTKAYILKYYPNGEMTYVAQHDSYTFKGTKELREIDFSTKTNAKSTINSIHLPTVQSGECTMVLMCNYGGHEHAAGNCSNVYWVIDCRAVGGGGSSTGSGGTGGGTTGSGNTTSGGNTNMGGGSGGSNNTTSNSGSSTASVHNTAATNGEIPTATIIPYKSLDVASILSLTTEQKNWLNNIKQLPIKKELQQYLFLNNTAENYEFAKELINLSLVNDATFTLDNFPGKNDGMPFEWWKDISYIQNNLKMPSISSPIEQTPNLMETLLFIGYPLQAILHVKNSKLAMNTAISLVQNGTYTHLHNGKADTFRHAFWNAYDTVQFGAYVTKKFTDAHEWNSNNHTLETQMDLFNNQMGRNLGETMSSFSTADYVKNEIMIAIYNGQFQYISPLDINGEIGTTSTIKFTNQ